MNDGRSLSPAHTLSPVWVMLKIFIYNLLWLAEYQCKGVVKFSLSDLFFWGQFRRSWKRVELENFTCNLSCDTRMINLFICMSQFKCFEFPIYIFPIYISDPHYFLRSKSSLLRRTINFWFLDGLSTKRASP